MADHTPTRERLQLPTQEHACASAKRAPAAKEVLRSVRVPKDFRVGEPLVACKRSRPKAGLPARARRERRAVGLPARAAC
eukprot:2468505-Prymnesium_polylepis.1